MNPLHATSRLCASLAVLVLAACATPGPGPSSAGDDPIHRHALVRTTSPAPDWAALRAELVAVAATLPGIEISPVDHQGINLQIPVADGFPSGSTEIRPSLARALDAIAPILAGRPGAAVQVIGHTDSQGSEMVNLRLSIARAEAVVEHLRQRGIGLERLNADGRGEADPLTSNATEEGRARNRRVELLLRNMP
ncbi:OmpA family protein [Thauera sp. WH-1]|uniref:OmpA family protein n=1 Tax=Thauera sp. WH-1 TaxID=3398230 RepID=UPI0039FD5F91